MKKLFLLPLIIFLSVGVFSCQKGKSPQKEAKSPQPYCICEYVVTPSFKAAIIPQKFLYPDPEKSSDKSMIVIIGVDLKEGASSRIVNHARKGDTQEFLKYANRYNDVTYNRSYPAPNSTGALAEPISKIRCYELSSKKEFVDVSDKVIFRALTYLPYIKSGYNDEIVPRYKEPIGGHTIGLTQYLVNKPLLDVTIDEMTLLDYLSWSCVFELVPIPPYQLNEGSEIKIAIETGGKNQEISAKYRTEL